MAGKETTAPDITIDHARSSSDESALVVDSGITSEEDTTSAELSSPIPALLGKFDSDSKKVTMHYKLSDIPDGLDFDDAKAVHGAFKARTPSNQYGIRRVPLALLQDAQTLNDKLIVVNYWRGLSKLEQDTLFNKLQKYYTAPSASNAQRRRRPLRLGNSLDQEKCLPLTTEVPFLRGKITENSVVKYFPHIPDEVCWDDQINLKHHFKPIPGKGVRRIPLALMQDARTDEDRLTIVNWWRGMSVEEQRESFNDLKAHYISPSVSNEILAGAGRYRNQVSNSQNEDMEQTFQSSPFIDTGSADSHKSLDGAANSSFSSPKANSAKRRKTGDSTSIVRKLEASAQYIVKQINHITTRRTTVGEGNLEAQGRTEQVLISITTVATSPKAGFHKKTKQIRRNKKVHIVARDKDTFKRVIGLLSGDFEANCDVFYSLEDGESTFEPQPTLTSRPSVQTELENSLLRMSKACELVVPDNSSQGTQPDEV